MSEKSMKEIIEDASQHKCPVQQSMLLLKEFMAGPMCGKCLPCPMSCYEMALIYQHLVDGKATETEIASIQKIAPNMNLASMCKKGKDTAKFIEDTLETRLEHYRAHTYSSCPDKECVALYKYMIIPENCTMCGDCLQACKFNAIIGEKRVSFLTGFKPFEIAEKRCTRCGQCFKVCKYGAIEQVDLAVGTVSV